MRRLRTVAATAVLVLVLGSGLFSPSSPAAAQTRDCRYFVADLTIPDGTQVEPGQEIEKIWRVRNCGDTTWDGYRAVREEGTFGPPDFAVPTAPPGATVDLTVRLQVPTSTGEHWALYRLVGPGSRLFGITVVVDVADCSPPERPALVPGGAPLDPQAVLLSSDELGGRWCLLAQEDHGIWAARRYSSAEYAAPRRVEFWVSVWPDEEQAEDALGGLPKGLAFRVSEAEHFHELDSGPAEIGGNSGRRLVWVDPSAGFTMVDYIFRVDRVLIWVRVRGGLGQEAELDEQAHRLTEAQLEREHRIVAATPPPPPAAPPNPDELYQVLLTAPFESSELPQGVNGAEVRPADPDWPPMTSGSPDRPSPRPIGIVTASLSETGTTGRVHPTIYYQVFRTRAEARQAYDAKLLLEWGYIPRPIPQLTVCGGADCGNGCHVLDGNVLIQSLAQRIHLDILGFGPTPPPEAVGLAEAGVAHLETIINRMLSGPAHPAPAPIQLPRR
jgi:hypothetical protein